MAARHPLLTPPPQPVATPERPAVADDVAAAPPPAAPDDRVWPLPWMGPFLVAMSMTAAMGEAARSVGVHRVTAWRAIQAHEEFAVAVNDARDAALDRLEAVLYQRATIGSPTRKTVSKRDPDGNVLEETITEDRHISDLHAMFLLKRWRPEFRDSFRIGGDPDSGPIRIRIDEASLDHRIDDLLAGLGTGA